MPDKSMLSRLQLAYAPISNYDFVYLRKDASVQKLLENSKIYIIVQRPRLVFNNLYEIEGANAISFDIVQHGNTNALKCIVPLNQPMLGSADRVELGFYDPGASAGSDIDGLRFWSGDALVLWVSPDKFLFHMSRGHIIAGIAEGDIRDYMRYKVHYVGRATGQPIWKRLCGHDKLQDIISIERPIISGQLPTHEVALLLIEVGGVETVHFFHPDGDPDESVSSLFDRPVPSKTQIALDAEKALIRILDPSYNVEKYESYPKSSDGLFKFNLTGFYYKIADNVTLYSDENEIVGDRDDSSSSTIEILDNETIELIEPGGEIKVLRL